MNGRERITFMPVPGATGHKWRGADGSWVDGPGHQHRRPPGQLVIDADLWRVMAAFFGSAAHEHPRHPVTIIDRRRWPGRPAARPARPHRQRRTPFASGPGTDDAKAPAQ
jgi:hypothetical protein